MVSRTYAIRVLCTHTRADVFFFMKNIQIKYAKLCILANVAHNAHNMRSGRECRIMCVETLNTLTHMIFT